MPSENDKILLELICKLMRNHCIRNCCIIPNMNNLAQKIMDWTIKSIHLNMAKSIEMHHLNVINFIENFSSFATEVQQYKGELIKGLNDAFTIQNKDENTSSPG